MERSSEFLVKMEDLVRKVVAYSNIPCYRIDSTIENHVNSYGEQIEVPVIRVVGFFEDTISKITNVLNGEFELYQLANNNPDILSSSAKTYQATLRQNRLELPEYRILNEHKFDIRVSSILQDVYNAMHQNLSNGGTPLPEHMKRDFYRIGAFLEMADIEFIKIRNKVNNNDYTTAPGTMPDLPIMERAVRAEAPIPPTPPTPVKAAPETTQAAAAPVQEVIAETIAKNASDSHIPHIESMDMTVDSFDSLGVSINSIDNKSNAAGNDYFDMLTSTSSQKQADSYDLLSSEQKMPVAAVEHEEITPVEHEVANSKHDANTTNAVVAEEPKNGFATPAEGVNLNIDKIDTFNMNVSGMIERTTEIIREAGAGTALGAAAGAGTALGAAEKKEEPNQPVNMDENAQMNDAMLKEYVMNSKLVKEVDRMIADRAGAKINDEVDIEGDVERLRFLKVYTLKQLQDKISDNKEDIVAFAEKWIGKDNGGSFDSGICLFYLEYLLVGKKNDPAFSVEYVLKFISDNDYSARYIIPTYNAIRLAAGEPASSNFAHLTLK